MKKNFMKGMTMLFAGMAFVACSHDVTFDENAAFESVKAQYKANFEQKYGKIDPNQSWDFTNYSDASQARTRGTHSVTSSRVELFNAFKSLVKNDRDLVKAIDFTTTDDLKLWNPNLSVTLYPAFSHAVKDAKYTYYHIGVVENGEEYDVLQQINTKDNKWYDAYSNNSTLNANSGRKINSKNLKEGENTYWVAFYTYPKTSTYAESNAAIAASMAEFKLEYYKEIVVNGDKYWCFDCDGDGNFSDLICLVDAADPTPIRKRYMIEDLGGSDDFDFNDIVVDVIEQNGSQKALIRAMGGTLNFTLKIGGTSWTKEGSKVKVKVNGETVEQDTEVATMYNTQNPDYDFVLAEFNVSGWNWRTNNITVTVEGNENLSEKKVIPFPREGEAPMIIAFDPITTHWNLERVPFDTGFFEPMGDDEVVE